MSKKVYKETYFQHDRYARQDPKIKAMLVHFRKESELKAQAAVCIFWWIVEDMHTDDYPINKLEVFADDYRCEVDFLKSILEDFDLFTKDGDNYVSNRVLKNLKEQEEKSEKARKAVEKRWNKKKEKTPETPQELPAENNKPEFDEQLVMSIIQIFNKEFNKAQIVSNENKQRIFDIHTENKMTIDTWQAVFSNAKRGWDIKGENKKPNLKNILDKWDLFASDDYYLAPDREKEAMERKAQEQAELERKEQERKQREEEIAKWQAEKDAICDAASAIKFLNKHNNFPAAMLRQSKMIKEYCDKYNFTVEDILAARGEENG